MTDKEILQKVIEKAEKNGYARPIYFYSDECATIEDDGTIDNGEWYENHITYSIQQIIFSHDFAKAFWGEELIWITPDEEYTDEAWKVHLQQMVLEKEPLKYLEQFIKE